ncbi:hypothetical protein HMPREF1640_00860 [Prevotella sp. S7-1-8]|nr:hypothetical protein HMPREF1640_00860 [Prevotella sp. S7-1-8]
MDDTYFHAIVFTSCYEVRARWLLGPNDHWRACGWLCAREDETKICNYFENIATMRRKSGNANLPVAPIALKKIKSGEDWRRV